MLPVLSNRLKHGLQLLAHITRNPELGSSCISSEANQTIKGLRILSSWMSPYLQGVAYHSYANDQPALEWHPCLRQEEGASFVGWTRLLTEKRKLPWNSTPPHQILLRFPWSDSVLPPPPPAAKEAGKVERVRSHSPALLTLNVVLWLAFVLEMQDVVPGKSFKSECVAYHVPSCLHGQWQCPK